MSKTKELQQIEKLEAELEALRAIVEKEDSFIEGLFEPKHSENYYVLSSEGDIEECVNKNQKCTDDSIEIGNSFSSEEAAEVEKKKRIVTAKLKKLADGYKFIEDRRNYELSYSYFRSKWEAYGLTTQRTLGAVYFKDLESAQHAIKELGDELNVLLST